MDSYSKAAADFALGSAAAALVLSCVLSFQPAAQLVGAMAVAPGGYRAGQRYRTGPFGGRVAFAGGQFPDKSGSYRPRARHRAQCAGFAPARGPRGHAATERNCAA